MTTKLQPTNLDQTLNYSVNKIIVSGVDVLNYAQSAFAQANTGAVANTFVQVGFPMSMGMITDATTGGLGGEQLIQIWDNRTTLPTHLIFANNTIQLDAGYLT